MRKTIQYSIVAALLGFYSCSTQQSMSTDSLLMGSWRGALDIGSGEEIPFLFDLTREDGQIIWSISNGQEKITANEITLKGDSLIVNMPVFNSTFFLSKNGSTKLKGYWQNFNKTTEYKIPFSATHGVTERFKVPENPLMDELGGNTWEVLFSPKSEKPSPAIGMFNTKEAGYVEGSFATEKGDYRFLEGLYCDSLLRLSCFDGAHAFLFKAKKQNDGTLDGRFWSGHKYQEDWSAQLNDHASLKHPDSLTHIISSEKNVDFVFPDLDGNLVSFKDERFKNKALILQIMGTWCPNCADESVVYKDLYTKYKDKGLEIVALCFESTRDHKTAARRIAKYKNDIGFEYETLVAGYASKKEATQTLEFLDEVSSFPTSVFIDKRGNVKRIHTGFYGPGTGEYFTNYLSELEAFIPTLLED
ncbi:MAG: TlpA family protein disulfide reductase [Flavobacteriales bacterium]|nr:TlpA family protein disulfide reductase [Flavobacteriales bacterium]